MNSILARKIGRKKTLKATTVVVVSLLLIFIFFGSQRDFANGILFALKALTNIWTILLFALFFGLTFFLGGKAGEDIIIQKKNFIWTTAKYSFTIFLILSIYNVAITCLVQKVLSGGQIAQLILSNSWLLVVIIVIWLWSTNQMKLSRNNMTN